jgi:tetratricopeptide (TPR) repeat protein
MPPMTLTDGHGLPVSTHSRPALERYGRALAMLNAFRADPLAEIEAALAEAPDFVMGHAFRAGLMAMSTERGLLPELRRSVEAAEALSARATEREWAHVTAARAWMGGDFALARRRYGEIAARWPRDLFALQVAHQLDFFLGDAEALRARPKAALRAWGPTEAGTGAILGMLAFGLEECGEYDAAEEAGRMAVARDPGDAWAIHAVAHVMEMQGRSADGADWLSARVRDWAPENMLAVHNWWHLALFHLDRGDHARALETFDRGVRRTTLAPAIELVDVSAMLWRFLLLGVDCGAARWEEAARLWEAQEPGFYAFNDCHAVMAFLGAGRAEDARRAVAAMEAAAGGAGTNAMMTREVGLPLARGLIAFAEGRHADASRLLAPLPSCAHRFGGSHAQRDVIALTRLEAALRAGDREAAAWLASARLAAKPESAMARGLSARVARLRHPVVAA